MKTSEQTGRIPIILNKRLSASICNNVIRPRSSYSVILGSGHGQLPEVTSNSGTVASSNRNSAVAVETSTEPKQMGSLLMRQDMLKTEITSENKSKLCVKSN